MRSLLIFAVLATTTIAANAGEIIFHTVSVHERHSYQETVNYVTPSGMVIRTENKNIPYNNTNLGIAYRTDAGWIGGLYYNSYRQATVYGAKEFMFTENFGAIVGGGTGYKILTGRKINALGAFEYKQKIDGKWKINYVVVPPISKSTVGVAHIELLYKYK
jgi:hypothetical protein